VVSGRFLELDEDIKALRQAALAAQCTAAPLPITLVSLMQQQEFDLMGVADFAARVEAAGIRLKLHPVRVPYSCGVAFVGATALLCKRNANRKAARIRQLNCSSIRCDVCARSESFACMAPPPPG
jgi:hypothetical protein